MITMGMPSQTHTHTLTQTDPPPQNPALSQTSLLVKY